MAVSQQHIRETIRQFLVENDVFDSPDSVKDDMSVVSSRAMDSLVSLRLIAHLEATFRIEITGDEISLDNFDSIDSITAFIQSKVK